MSRRAYLIAKAEARFVQEHRIPEPDPKPTLHYRKVMDDAYARQDMFGGNHAKNYWLHESKKYREAKHYRDEQTKHLRGRAERTLRRFEMTEPERKARRTAHLKARANATLNRLEMSPGHRVMRHVDAYVAARRPPPPTPAPAPHVPPVRGGGRGKLIALGAAGVGAVGGSGYLVARNRRRRRQ